MICAMGGWVLALLFSVAWAAFWGTLWYWVVRVTVPENEP